MGDIVVRTVDAMWSGTAGTAPSVALFRRKAMRYGFIYYLVFINLIAIILTIRDKHAAQQHRWRVPEATLLWVSILGGSLGIVYNHAFDPS